MSESKAEALRRPMESIGSENARGEKKNRRAGKRLGILFLAAIAMLCVALVMNDVLRQKWSYKDNAAQQIVQGFYREAPNSLDVLCLGASTVRNGVSGLEMYNEYGFTTYSRATSIQLPVLSYYLLQEALETQAPKAVVMDAATLSNLMLDQSPETMAGKMHEAIDYMPWSKYKFRMIQECLKFNSSISLLDFVFPLYAYHDRWTDIAEDDFTYREWQNSYCYKGQYPALKSVSSAFDEDYMSEDEEIKEVFYLDESLTEYCTRIIDLCREKGIEFVLVKTPTTGWNVRRHELTRDYAEAQGVAFIDYNDVALLDEIGFDAKTDFVDSGKHTNITGAKKISRHLGGYLAEVCDFADKRQDPAYHSWNEDYEKYANLLADVELLRETNLVGFLNKLRSPNYIAMISARNDVSKFFNDDVAQAFADLGINEPFADTPYLSYLALLDGGAVVYQQADENPEDNDNRLFYSTEYEGHSIQMSSLASPLIDNESSIVFDGEERSPSGLGFNIAVYDKSVDQFVVAKTFNTGKSGRNYTPPNPFSDYSGDPLGYLELLANDDYVTVLAGGGESSRYMPGVVNDKLAEMGLIPLDGEFNRPYLAVLNGGEVLYNVYGEPGEELETSLEVEDIPVTAISGARASAAHTYISIDEDERVNHKYNGLTFCVYSKSARRLISANRFDWSNNYTAPKRVYGKNTVVEVLDAAKQGGYDVLCMNVRDKKSDVPSSEIIEELREYGFGGLNGEDDYIGLVRADGISEEAHSGAISTLECELGGAMVQLSVGDKQGEAIFDGVGYAAARGGMYVFVYDSANRAVLTQVRFDRNTGAETNPFTELASDPIGYFNLLSNEDYVTVMAAGSDGSRYMPGVVNDKLAQMGLIPLDREINCPYVAVLNGAEVIYNEYGSPGEEISALCDVEGIPITAISSTGTSNPHAYISVNGENPWTVTGKGLCICVYSKSEERMLSYNRFDWSANYTIETRINGKSNLIELLEATARGGFEALCLYVKGEEEEATSGEALTLLNQYGFSKLDGISNYAGIVMADGQTVQADQQTHADLKYELKGVPVALRAKSGSGEAVFDGVSYNAGSPGLYLFVYDAASRAVLTQLRVDSSATAEVSVFAEANNDPLRYLDLLANDDYITAIAISAEGSRYMPGVVNDKLVEMGLIPLDKEFNRPYVAVLNGSEVVYNEYGDPGTEIVAECEVEGTPVLVVSSTVEEKQRAYFSVGNGEFKRNKRQTGLIVYVYSKSEQRELARRRFDWSSTFLSPTKLNDVVNPLELLTMARHAGYDVMCVANIKEDSSEVDAEALKALHGFGFVQLGENQYYAGILYFDGRVEQVGSEEDLSLPVDLDGSLATLKAREDACAAIFREAAEYSSVGTEIHVFVYDEQNKAVVADISYANDGGEEGESEDVSEN